ncbi:MAG: translation initiation factor eIF-1A [Thermoplasmatota archaeon]
MAGPEEETIRDVRLPNRDQGELFAVADQRMGAGRIKIICEDSVARMGRIRGKMKRRAWIRSGDLLIVRPWEFQNEKADILYRYSPTETSHLARQQKIPDTINVFET